jgi:hypothetical protein
MDIFDVYATDETAEVEGRWFPLDKKTKVLVARTGNANYLKAIRQRMKAAQIDTEDQSDDNEKLVTDLIIETMAETVLLGWKGMSMKGEELTYSKTNAMKALAVKGFRARISSIADKLESFRVKEEEDQGNA